MTKTRRAIAAEDIGRVFDDDRIEELARYAQLPAIADKVRFADGIREAARIYARDSREPSVNELYAEIEKLHHAAAQRKYDELVVLIQRLSPKARNLLESRGSHLGITLEPNGKAEQACASIEILTGSGGRHIQGRKRPGDKRSRPTWRPSIFAPEPRRNFPKREAERYFVIMLQTAWLDAVGAQPSLAVNRERPSPFAKMVKRCFELVGAKEADAYGLINSANRRRNQLRKRPVTHQI